jgi:hypothetical protein
VCRITGATVWCQRPGRSRQEHVLAEPIAAALAVILPSRSDGWSNAAVLAAAVAELIRDLGAPLVYQPICGRWVWPDEFCQRSPG